MVFTKMFAVAGMATCMALTPLAAVAGQFSTIYSFPDGYKDGATPEQSALTYQSGLLFGTTHYGGTLHKGDVYSVDPSSGAFAVIYDFTKTQNQFFSTPSTMIAQGGALYGTIATGGARHAGLVFQIDPSTGAETDLYEFPHSRTGRVSDPGAIIFARGAFYGTAAISGGNGAIFRLRAETGKPSAEYEFGPPPDGAGPNAPLVYQRGVFYGTTCCGGASGGGTVFKFDAATKTETVLYSFPGGSTANSPSGGLILAHGVLYGATLPNGCGAGTNCGCPPGSTCGTIYKVDPTTGVEADIYDFVAGAASGSEPNSPLVYHNGALYGTAFADGKDKFGTLFKVDTTTGSETTLHSFTGKSDGVHPAAPVIYANGAFYGTTLGRDNGYAYGNGTVFRFTP